MKSNSKIAEVIFWIGIFVICGGIIGSFIIAGQNPIVEITEGIYYDHTEESYNWSMALEGVFACIIAGVLLIGFSEVISLLQQIADGTTQTNTVLSRTFEAISLEAGTYIVGIDFPAGNYHVYGTGELSVSGYIGGSSAAGVRSIKLSEKPDFCNLTAGQKITLDGKARFVIR